MTPVFCCGFECGIILTGILGQHWTATTGIASINTNASFVRSGARSLRINGTGGGGNGALVYSVVSSQTLVFRFYVYYTTLPNIDTLVMVTGQGEARVGAVFKNSDSSIYAGDIIAGTFGATGVSVTTGVWYLIDVKVNSSANPWTVDVRVNGTACGQSTRAAVSQTMTELTTGGRTGVAITCDYYIDDVLASHTAADYPLGAGYVNHFVPTSDGTHNVAGAADFRRGDTTTDITNSTTDAYLLVDEVPLDDSTPDTDDHIRIVAPNAVTDYVECVYGPAPGISTPTVAPRTVEVMLGVFAAGAQPSDEIFKLNDNGTVDNVYDGTGVAGITSGRYKRKNYALAPTGGAWTVVSGAGNFNNIRFRYGYATDANPDKSLMCTMIEAEFASAVAGTGLLPFCISPQPTR
jgi:hypothetical protein